MTDGFAVEPPGDFVVRLPGEDLTELGLSGDQVLVGRLPGEALRGRRRIEFGDVFRRPLGGLDGELGRLGFPPFEEEQPIPGLEEPLPLVWPDPCIPDGLITWPPDESVVPLPIGTPGLVDAEWSRHELTVPIAPVAVPTDADLFESPDGGARFALPRYDVAFDRVGDSSEPRIRIGGRMGTETLVVGLLQVPSPASAPGVSELPHAVGVSLKYRVPVLDGGGVVVELPFEEVSLDETGTVVTAELALGTPGLRQQLLAALGSLEAAVRLVVRRGVTVGVPTGGTTVLGEAGYRQAALLLEWTAQPTPLLITEAQRARFGGGAVPGTVQPMRRIRIPHGDRSHSYWQDPARPERYFYLPDAFRLARLPGPGRPPALRVTAIGGGGQADVRATLDFLARPVITPERLDEAVPELTEQARRLGASGPLRLEMLADPQPLLRLALPENGAPATALTERADARIDLELGVSHAETFSPADFRVAYEALFGASLSLLRGEVRVAAGGGPADDVPLDLRLEQTAGDVLTLRPTAAAPGRITATLANAIESPVRLDGLAATALVAGRRVPMTIEGTPAGTVLAAGQALQIALVPAEPLPAKGADALLLDQRGLAVEPDRAAIWAAVFDDRAQPQWSRTVTVEAVPGMFAGPQGERVAMFVVTVEGAGSVRLTEAEPSAALTVPSPVRPLLTGEPLPPLRHRTQTVWASGEIGTGPWQSTDATILFPLRTPPGGTA